MRISPKLKRIGNYFGGFFFFVICIFGSYICFQNSNVNLESLDNYTGAITEKGITNNYSSISGKGKLKSEVFYFKMHGLNQVLASYNPKKEYEELDHNLNIGDTIKVYFQYSKNIDIPNLATYQIEKQNLVILSAKEYKSRERIAGFIALIAAFVMIGVAIYQDKKYWKKS